MKLWKRVAVCLALAIGIGLLATPAYHSLRIYHLSYDGKACTDAYQRDCLQAIEATVSDKKTEKVYDGTGSTTNYYLFTERGKLTVDEGVYDSVRNNDRVQVVSLNNKHAFVSYRGVRDYTGGGQESSAIEWAMVIGALLIAFSAAIAELLIPNASGTSLLALAASPATALFGAIPVSLFSDLWGLKGIIISWIAAVITGASVAIKANYQG